MRDAAERISQGQKVAVMFGPERAGMENDDIARANAIVSVPVNPDFASLNLGQCVLLMAYEWRRASGAVEDRRIEMAGAEWAQAHEVEKLAERGLQRHLVEKLQERHVEGLAAKVTLEDLVDLRFEDDPIVDRVHLHVVELVPARLSAPRLRLVHDVVRHQEERLQPLDAPAEDGGASVLLVGKLAAGR